MKRCLLFLAAAAVPALAQTETVTYSYNGRPLSIVYSDDVFTVAEIQVPRALAIRKLTVRLQIDYQQVSDLNVYLFSASGTRIRLLEKNCGRLPNIDTTFDDEAPSKFSTSCPAEAGRGPFQGNEPLANANAQSSLGVWRLAIQNNGTLGRRGTLRTFAVTITGDRQNQPIITPDTIVDYASGRGGSLATGQLVTVFGSGLGPTIPVSADGNWPTTLANTSVTLDGTSIPIGYASFGELVVQIPFNLLTPQDVLLRVNFANQPSNGVPVRIRAARPSLYTTGQSGRQAKAYNQNGQLNSPANPAPRGSYMTVYASGLGPTVVAVPSGARTPLSVAPTLNPVAAYVNGDPAPVTFAGLAPGFVGIYQMNFVVPMTARSGSNELIIATANGFSSQENVTIEVQ